MSNPHKPWALIDSSLQRQLGHYSHYGMPTDNLSVASPGPTKTLEYIIPRYPIDPRDEISYPVYHFVPGEYPQAADIALLSQNAQPDSVPAEPQPITTFGEGFKQAFDQWKNNYSYGYGRFLKNINYEDEIRYGLQALDENPELSRGNVQEINRSIKTLRRGIAERQNRIEAGEGTPEDEAAILKDSEKIRGLYAMQQQYYKGATPEEAEAWRNDYIAQGGTGMQRMAEALEEQKNYRLTEGWGKLGEITFNVAQTLPAVAATAANPVAGAIAVGASMGDIGVQNIAQSNMQADLIEERTGEDVSTAQRLGQAALVSGVDGISQLLGIRGTSIAKPFLRRIGSDIAFQGATNGIGSMAHDLGKNLILGDDLSAKEITSNALKNAATGSMIGLGSSAIGHTLNRATSRRSPFREIPDETGNLPLYKNTDVASAVNRPIRYPYAPKESYNQNASNRSSSIASNGEHTPERSSFRGEGFRLSYPLPEDWDNTPIRIPFATYHRRPLAEPGTYVRPYQNPGTIDPNGLRMIPRNEGQGNLTIPMGQYRLSYPLPEGMSNEPITIPQGRYGRGSSFWGEDFRLSYPLPEDWDNTPVRIPFATYRRGPLAEPGTYTRPYQDPGTIDPNGLTYISPNKYTVPYGRYTLSYPLPEGMSNEPITIPRGRYGRGSSFWGENFKLSYPLPEDWDNTPVRIPFATYHRGPLAAPGTYVRPYQNPGTIDPNGLRMIPRTPNNPGNNPDPGSGTKGSHTPFEVYESMFGIDKLKGLDDADKPIKIPFDRYESQLGKNKKKKKE